MYEDELKTLDDQIERVRKALKKASNETAKWELGKRLKVYEDMRCDLLLQIKYYAPRPETPGGGSKSF